MTPRIAIATCREVPELDADAAVLRAALDRRGIDARPVVWDDPADRFAEGADAVLIRSTWDYSSQPGRFLDWVASVRAPLFNGPDVVHWNIDKRYLNALAEAGLPTVPSVVVAPGEAVPPFPADRFVVKPTVSAGAKDTALYDGARHDAARAHLTALLDAGRAVLVQPYLERVETAAETATIFVDGVARHAMRKEPLLELDAPAVEGLFKQEQMSRRAAGADVLELGERVLAWVAERFGTPLYARVDTVEDDDGRPVLLELELIEPSLFLDFCPETADALADALLARLAGG